MQDEVLLYPFNTGFADSLDLLGIDYVFESFNGTHTSESLKRVPIALRFLDSVINPVTGVFPACSNIISNFNLSQNYPNPFNPTTTIKYSIPKLNFVTIKIYNVLGIEVATLVNEEQTVGTYELNWNAANLPSGVYFYQLRAGNYVETKKMILLR
ncbi:MAG: T9SS type A sorting domain-containing protein [Ignavibacterium sp.]|nr:T9SS type A sorting domain-containing protein [Ignavibacterium sp.]